MKLLIVLFSLMSFFTNLAIASDSDFFVGYSESGYRLLCNSIMSHDNYLTRENHLKNIFEAQSSAKDKCQFATGKLCGIVSWGAENTDKGCFGKATATVINK